MISKRRRRIAVAIVLLLQTAFFFTFLIRPPVANSDNIRYEVAGYRLASGHGLSLPWDLARDDVVRDWVCSHHPGACDASDGSYPVAIYAPGYSVFIAFIYLVVGRSLWAVVLAQLVLLWVLFILFEQVAARYLASVGYTFAMGICATYPFIAHEAGWILSDHLHVVLLFSALAALLLFPPGRWRGASFGGLMAAATLVRPYSLFVFPAVIILPTVWRALRIHRREAAVSVAVFLLPFVMWSARNAYWYGHFVPLCTDNLGPVLFHTTLEWEQRPADTGRQAFIYGSVQRIVDPENTKVFGLQETYRGSRLLQAEAMRRIREHPFDMLGSMAVHIPKLWLSLRPNGENLSRAWPLLVIYMGGLCVLGLVGMWLKRRDGRWHPVAVTILVYWVMLLPIPGDARRTLPLRLPMLLFAAVTIESAWSWWQSRSAVRSREPNPDVVGQSA